MSEMMRLEMTVMGMKHRIVAALNEHTMNLDQDIKEAVEQAVKSFDVNAFVRQHAQGVLERSIRKAIEDAVAESIKQSAPFKTRLKSGISMALEEGPDLPPFEHKAQVLLQELTNFENSDVKQKVLEDTLRDFWYLGRRGW